MSDLPINNDTIVLLINCGIASVVVCLVAILLARTTRSSGPQWQHNILVLASLTALLLPIAQYLLSLQGLGLVAVHATEATFATPFVVQVVLSLWLSGVAIRFMGLATGLLVLSRLRKTLIQRNDERLSRLIDRAAQHVGLATPPQVSTTRLNVGPMLLGVRHPVVVVPQELNAALSDEQLLCVLVHEFEHVRRRDVVVSTLQQFIACFYWWNPLFRLAAQEMEAFRERACDDRVIALPSGPRNYASALLLAAQCSSKAHTVGGPVIALLSRQSDLVARIDRFTSQQNEPRRFALRQSFLIAAASVVIVVLGSMPLVRWDVVSVASTAIGGQHDASSHADLLAQRQLSYMRIHRGYEARRIQIANVIAEHQANQSRGLIVDMRTMQLSVPQNPSAGKRFLSAASSVDLSVVKKPNPRIVLLVDAEDALSANILDELAKNDLPTLVISQQTEMTAATDTSRHGDPPPRADRQLLLAINFLSHV